MVRKARELEMQYMEELKVLEDSDRDACMAETGHRSRLNGSDINKGDSVRPIAGWSVKSHVDGQQLLWKIGQRRSLRHLYTKR